MDISKRQQKNHVIWITGLSGAGKTTLANKVYEQLRIHSDAVVLLDGDILRAIFGLESSEGSYHDKQTRMSLALKYSYLCKLLSDQGITVVIATVSLFKEVHEWNRRHLQNYLEIYLKVPITELQRRDPKGLYAKFARGETRQVAGLDLEIDEPEFPDLLLEYQIDCTVDKFCQSVMDCLELHSGKGK